MVTTNAVVGVVADKTFIMLNGAKAVTDVSYYNETIKDSNGKKHHKRHSYFNVLFGDGHEYSLIRFERLRNGLKPHRDIFLGNSLVVYVDEPVPEARIKVLKEIMK